MSKTTKCRDFTVIFPVFPKMHRDFADFFTVIFLQPYTPTNTPSQKLQYPAELENWPSKKRLIIQTKNSQAYIYSHYYLENRIVTTKCEPTCR